MTEQITYRRSISDIGQVKILGTYIKTERLNQNKTQQALADAAGLDRTTIINLESGKSGTLLSFIQALRALDRLEILSIFESKTQISPLLLAEREFRYKTRKRARSPQRASKSTAQNSTQKQQHNRKSTW